ncbi:ABC transporter substrate-binding protein [Nocardioides sp. InS609-2]|uniref:ABC transporter substrate-binding protein n=1 Tax=Nocardioides sp. InS609-2 TaxID=2760705 RepID=UPI0020C1715E|nr:ABC transporter substrate-binding protein [Nocardioides sp. InS609-2]
MKRTKSLAVVAGFAMVTLAACGGNGDSGGGSGSENKDKFKEAGSGFEQVADAEGPAPEIEGAATGGTITALIPLDPGPEDLDPTNGWSVLGNSIQQALTTRALTQYRRNADSGEMELVPDIATDLGTPNEDFTEWKFTIKDNVKWETGDPVTAEEVKNGILRSFDTETFTSGPGQAYTVGWVDCPEDYAGPTKSGDCDAVQADGQDLTVRTSKPFPDFNFWSTFMAIGPVPLKNADFPEYGRKPLSTGPYKIKEFRVNESLTLVKNDQWDPASDPARHQYADEWVFKFDQDEEKTDQIMLSDSSESATTIANHLGPTDANELKAALGANYIQQTGQCISTRTPDTTKITDLKIRQAIGWAFDFNNVQLASGNIPGVTRIPAQGLMPPGMSGRKEFFPADEQFSYNADKAKALLEEAGEPGYKLTFIYDDSDPTLKAGAEAEKKGYEQAGFTVEMIPYQEDAYALFDDPDNPINKKLNLRSVNWCSDWPAGSTMLPPLIGTDQAYNTSFFSNEAVDARMDEIATLPIDEQAAAWGDLDEEVGQKYLPNIVTAYRNDLFGAGAKIGGFSGDAAMSAINYKDLFVKQ